MYMFQKEEYYGNIEYKLKFTPKNINKIHKYITQLNFRINEGNGRCIYIVGISDDGYINGLDKDSISTTINFVNYMCQKINLDIKLILRSNYLDKTFLIFSIIKHNFEPQLLF